MQQQTVRAIEQHGARLLLRDVRTNRMRIFLDDERVPPEGWTLVRWPDEAIALLEQTEISLDHDLGDDDRGTGYDVVLWIERAVAERGFDPPRMRVHSANPSARARMEAGIEAIARLHRNGEDAG